MAKFHVEYIFHARASDSIEAESFEGATRLINERVNADNFELDAEHIDDVDFTIRELHPVTRNGHKLWTTYVRPDDSLGHGEAP